MLLLPWEKLPTMLQVNAVKPYYERLKSREFSLICKRIFDIFCSLFLLVLLFPIFAVLAIAIRIDSDGSVFFRQVRITRYGREFNIFKFRTMVKNAEQLGTQVTTDRDSRITKVGVLLRKLRLDELPQLLNVLRGDMSFVGTRPEVPRYVASYTPEMLATLLLPAGITSAASIVYKDEAMLLEAARDTDQAYVERILPNKMKYNLESLLRFSFWGDIKIMVQTVLAVIK